MLVKNNSYSLSKRVALNGTDKYSVHSSCQITAVYCTTIDVIIKHRRHNRNDWERLVFVIDTVFYFFLHVIGLFDVRVKPTCVLFVRTFKIFTVITKHSTNIMYNYCVWLYLIP